MSNESDSPKLVVCVTGPESTGKTTLARDLADALGGTCVEEFAREYSAARYQPAGIWEDDEYVIVASEQARRLGVARTQAEDGPIVCDTDAFTVWVWHRVYTVQPLPELTVYADERCDLYVMPTLEIPFIPDGIRELAWPRDELYELFLNELVHTRRRFIEVSGTPEERVALVLAELEQMARLSGTGETG